MPLEDILAAEYRDLPPEQLEQIFEGTLGGEVYPEDLEDFWGTLKNIGGAVSKALPQVLPVAGTVVGTAFGGPLGGALGGALGSAAGGALGPSAGGGTPAQRPSQMAPSTTPPMPVGSPATAQLLQAMFNPKMLQALMAMLMGQAGRRNIPVGNTQAPVGAFTNLLSVLANQAAAEYNAIAPTRGGSPRYFEDFAGEATGDPAVAEHRAAALWELLQETSLEQRRSYAGDSRRRAYREDERELDERELDDQFYDAMDLTELDDIYAS